MTNEKPIGIFDSGIGGTSIWKEINQLLPYENTIYLADSKNAPYGQKSTEEILQLSIKNTELLLEKNCKLIVVACNTATTNAIEYLRKTYSVPFIGIEPAIKPASLQSKTKTIGILATKGTLNSTLFEASSAQLKNNITVIEQMGEGLVDLIEKGKIDSVEMNSLLKKYLTPMLKAKADCIVLGCTHYPYLINPIKAIVGNSIQIIDSGKAVAKQTKHILELYKIANLTKHKNYQKFFINRNKKVLTTILKNHPNTYIEQVDF